MYKGKSGLVAIFIMASYFSCLADESIGVLESKLKNTQADTLRIEVLLQMGDYFEYTDYDSALHFYRQALELSQNSQESSNPSYQEQLKRLEIKSHRYIIHLNSTWGKYQEAIDQGLVILEMYYDLEDYERVIHTKLNIGNNYYYLGDIPAAVDYFVKALDLAHEHNSHENIASINTNLATIHYQRGNYLQSLDYYQTALKYFKEYENVRDEGLAYLGIGNIHSSLKNFAEAKQNYQMALDRMDELEDHAAIATIHLSLGSLYYQLKDTDNADHHYQKSQHHATIGKDLRVQGQALLNLGILYAGEGNYTKALEHYDQALEIATESGNRHTEASTLRNKALTLLRLKKFRQALELAQNSFQLSREVESLEDQAESLKVISRINEQQGRYASALTYYQEYKLYNDSLLNIENQRQINEMDAVFQSEQKQQKIDLQNLQIEKNKIELRRKNQLVNSFIIILVFVIILAIATLLHFNQKKITNMEIARQKAVIAENIETINGQKEELKEAHLQISLLEKEKDLQQQKARQTLYLAESISAKSHDCSVILSRIFFNKIFETNLGEKVQISDICIARELKNQVFIVIADIDLPMVDKKLINIALGSYIDRHAGEDFIQRTDECLHQLKEYLQEIISGVMGENKTMDSKLALLYLDKTHHKVKFVSEAPLLGLAIARNPGSIFRPMFDYQEIQMIDPAAELSGKTSIRFSPSGMYEFKLKPADRIYLLNPGKPTADNDRESRIARYRKVIQFVDNHQNMDITMQGEYLEKEFGTASNPAKHNIMIRGMEI